MNREYHRWHSPHLQREMELLVFGHAGAKVLVFPTRSGRFHEYEDMRVVQALTDKINGGHLQLYCVEALAFETFYCPWRAPAERIRRYQQYEDYIRFEVLPWIATRNPHPCTIAHGCSLGAYYATNIAFKHPQHFKKLAAFSGRYDLTLNVEHFHNLFDGYYSEDIYFNTPCHFLPNLGEGPQLEALRHMDIVLTIGKHDPFLANNHHLSHILSAKGIRHVLHEWEGRAHQARYWRKMAALYL